MQTILALVPPGSSQQPLPLPPRPPPRPPKLRLRSEPGPPWGRLLLPAREQTAQERGRGRGPPSSSTTACHWPTTPATQTGPEFELLVSPPRATDAVARGAPSLTGFLSLPTI